MIKTSTKQFPLQYLSGLELNQRGEHKALLSRDGDGNVEAIALMWVDRDRRYFISNAQSIEQAESIYQICRRQLDTSENADPERHEFTIEQPDMVKCYYDTCGEIDRHNKIRQDELELERKIRTHDFSKRVNTTVFGMIVVDTMNFHQACAHPNEIDKCPDDFITYLSEEMIDNSLDTIGLRREVRRPNPNPARNSYSPHLSPCKEKRRKRTGEFTNYCKQGHCRLCGKKTTHVCSECEKMRNDNPQLRMKEQFFCRPHGTGRNCFELHVADQHAK